MNNKNLGVIVLLGLILVALMIIAVTLVVIGWHAAHPAAAPTPPPTWTPTSVPTWTPVPTSTPLPPPPTPIIIVATPTPAPTIVGVITNTPTPTPVPPTPTPWVVTATPTPNQCWVQVPELTNMKADVAYQKALQSGLAPAYDTRCLPEGDWDRDRVVTSQSLAPGTWVACNSDIILTFPDRTLRGICHHPQPTPTPTPWTPPTPPPQCHCPPEEGAIHVVQHGEWLTQLCRDRGYNEGSGKLSWCVRWAIDHSCLPNPDRLKPGDQICLPHPGR